jgi:hypothetical protein
LSVWSSLGFSDVARQARGNHHPLLVLLNGGLGWTQLFTKAGTNEGGLWGVLMDLPPSFTVVPETTWRWGNAISAF